MDPFDALPFGESSADPAGCWLAVRWAEPRKIRQVVVRPLAATSLDPLGLRLQYWHRHWNGLADPPTSEMGAGGVGWAKIDDWFNGEWREAATAVTATADGWRFTFRPSDAEFTDLAGAPVSYRQTLQLRLVSDAPLPPLAWQAFTDAQLRPLSVRLEWGTPKLAEFASDEPDELPIEVHNGQLLGQHRLADRVHQLDLACAADPLDARYDRTVVTVRSAVRPFSFAAADIAQGERILVDDLGAYVAPAGDPLTLDEHRARLAETGWRTVYDRVATEPEQTLSRAVGDMPRRHPLYFVHALPGNRNAMHQLANGDVVVTASRHWFNLPPSPRDTARKQWDGERLTICFERPEATRGGRELLDGWLPQVRTWWQDGPIHTELTSVLDALDGQLAPGALDQPTALYLRWRCHNNSPEATGTAQLKLRVSGESVRLDGDLVVADYSGEARCRCLWRDASAVTGRDGQLHWSRLLQPGESAELLLIVPAVTVTIDEAAPLLARDFADVSGRVCDWWRELTAPSARLTTPEPWLDDFWRAHVRHQLVNCVKELDSDRLLAHVGTFSYGVFPNESVMMIADLDRRGLHGTARACLEAFLHYQGTAPIAGNFASHEGLFHGAAGHQHLDYNKNHGYVMWALAEHWWLTRDRAWLDAAAPKLVAACEWVVRERQATLTQAADGRRPNEYGFLPAGSLEDVTDYWYWLATNAATVWGFDNLAAALADADHLEAPRLVAEAAAYRQDVLAGLDAARVRCPVVKLRDGTWVPKTPSHPHLRGRAHGWIRETLEGPLFLVFYRLIDPSSPQATWILKDYEDNLYISDAYGYAIANFDRFWFSRGGFSMQAQLLDGPPCYLWRDEVPHFVRGYFNGFASAFDPEVRMCNEHCLPELGYPAGDHFKTSDEAQSTSWLRLMFVREAGEELFLGQGVPRYWLAAGRRCGLEDAPTRFGTVSVSYQVAADGASITATVTPPARPVAGIRLRFRHPSAAAPSRVTIDGAPAAAEGDWVRLPVGGAGALTVTAAYA